MVVATRNRPVELARCLEALKKLFHPSHELVVIDNSGGDRAVEEVAHRSGAISSSRARG